MASFGLEKKGSFGNLRYS